MSTRNGNLLSKTIPLRKMTPEQKREYEMLRYKRRRNAINKRRRELYKQRKEQAANAD